MGVQDQQSRELSQRHTARRAQRLKVTEQELKLGRVVALDACEVRGGQEILAGMVMWGAPKLLQ